MTKKETVRDFAHACIITKRKAKRAVPYPKPENDFEEGVNAIALIWTVVEAMQLLANFEPDYDNPDQDKWYGWLRKEKSGFVLAGSYYGRSNTNSAVGSRLALPSSEHVEYLHKKFIKPINKVLLKSKPKKQNGKNKI